MWTCNFRFPLLMKNKLLCHSMHLVRVYFFSIIMPHCENTEFGDSLTEENDVKSWVKVS